MKSMVFAEMLSYGLLTWIKPQLSHYQSECTAKDLDISIQIVDNSRPKQAGFNTLQSCQCYCLHVRVKKQEMWHWIVTISQGLTLSIYSTRGQTLYSLFDEL